MSAFFSKLGKTLTRKAVKAFVRKIFKIDSSLPTSSKGPPYQTPRHGHCADNPNRTKGRSDIRIRDYLKKFEIDEIAEKYFDTLGGPPQTGVFLKFPERDDYDKYIRGWTKYWNDVFKPKDPLDPDLVKALIGSESAFKLSPPPQNAGPAGKARGLAQLTDQTVKDIGDENGVLLDHLVKLTTEETSDPNVAICSAFRWLFYKKADAARLLSREATWNETVVHYKGAFPSIKSGKPHKDLEPFNRLYKEIKK